MSIKYSTNQDCFTKIPGSIICYWLSPKLMSHIENDMCLEKRGNARQGLSTSDNNRFLRLWHEVDFGRIGFGLKSCEETMTTRYRWYPYNKAGYYRKWSTINEFVVNYQYDGKEIKQVVLEKYKYLSNPGFVVKNTESYFCHGITWNDVANGSFSCRYVPDGYIFADAGPMFFCDDDFFMMAYFNSKVFQVFADVICQGLHYSTGHIPKIPFKSVGEVEQIKAKHLAYENYRISTEDRDQFETSWEFQKHPLV